MVDGEWKFLNHLDVETDSYGNINNVVEVIKNDVENQENSPKKNNLSEGYQNGLNNETNEYGIKNVESQIKKK